MGGMVSVQRLYTCIVSAVLLEIHESISKAILADSFTVLC